MPNSKDKTRDGWKTIHPRLSPENHRRYAEFRRALSGASALDEHTGGAVFVWMILPALLREKAILACQGNDEMGDEFWADIENAILRAVLAVWTRRADQDDTNGAASA